MHPLITPLSDCRLQVDDPCQVGVMVLGDLSSHDLRHLEPLILKSERPWIAVGSEEQIGDADKRRIMAHLSHSLVSPQVDILRLSILLEHASELARLQQRDREEQSMSTSAEDSEYEFVGTTPVMWNLFKTIRKVAVVDAPVFISGESGTGKELTAQAIHERSARSREAFHAINCGALPEHLIQSELFGHEKGAFTGATQRKIGRIEAADGGTLFLDEIGDLPLELQVNLLRFLEMRCIQRVGGLDDIPVDVRIVAATHVNLDLAVKEGRFREDLYHRLNVLQVKVPALREHSEDIEILARFFFERFSSEKASCLKGFSREALSVMQRYHWPGNVRELINRVRRAMVMCENRLIQPEDLGIERRGLNRHQMTLEEVREEAERDALLSALGRNKYRVNAAAKELGVSRVTIYRLLDKHGISRTPPQEAAFS
ncbi:sigma-54 dependent transcriptional regulator [Halomonas sp. DP4Y7-1]|nr:sigma-54-dependent Fis family transcriptional regulator [Halomonas litopenaei]MBY5924512.1 sigma-54 dependent transcriptional regulator [Halomonas sp. DP4Y7-2]MBY5929777.1 sigma-54 dependent transcriptional regulator [Halomonas sp. DP8Y7-3]MBY5968473.1 sigma-54 dependent transcriptional regulator [Halomonas denitrificans]MBY5984150.1 sigma-54 dependent transcriptional regulator [Halomonas sp. DP5Y7-2]MBY6028267.1 sigma-54 dependent transcriptional regulator [Halomonas sp. DP8Y7-1]MBY623155